MASNNAFTNQGSTSGYIGPYASSYYQPKKTTTSGYVGPYASPYYQPKTTSSTSKTPIVSSPTTASTPGILPTTSADKYNRTTGQLNPNYIDPNAPKPPTYSGVFSSLANSSSSPYNQQAMKNIQSLGNTSDSLYNQNVREAVKGLLNSQALNQQASEKANDIATNAGQKIEKIGRVGAGLNAGYSSTGTSPVGEGNAAIANQSTAAQQQAVSQGANMQLNAVEKQLQAQNQAQSGLSSAATNALQGQGTLQSAQNSAASNALQGQSNLQSALYNAGQLAQPQLGSIGQVPFNPLDLSQGNVLGSQGGGLNQAANLLGSFEAAKSNANLAGTATPNAANDVYQQAFGAYQNLQQAVQNVDNFGQLLLQNMGGINPSDVKYANQTIGQVRNQLSSQQQAQFDTTFAQLKAQIASLLSVGGAQIPTQITADANKIIDGSAPIGTLTATLNRIAQEGNLLLQTQAGKVNSAKETLNSSVGGGGTPSANGGSIVQTSIGPINTNW